MHVVVVVVVLSTDEHVLCSEHALYVLLCGGSVGVSVGECVYVRVRVRV